jgi:hypothetical protein
MIISIDVEIVFDKTGYPFIIKALKKLRIKGSWLHIIQGNIINSQSCIEWQKIKSTSSNIRNEAQGSTLFTLIPYSA